MPSSRVSRGSLHLGKWVGRKQAGPVGRYERQPRPERGKKTASPEKPGPREKNNETLLLSSLRLPLRLLRWVSNEAWVLRYFH